MPDLSDKNPMVKAFMDAAAQTRASPDDLNVAIILLMAEMSARYYVSRQDTYLNWLVCGAENVLKDHGLRQTARPNPMAGDPAVRN